MRNGSADRCTGGRSGSAVARSRRRQHLPSFGPVMSIIPIWAQASIAAAIVAGAGLWVHHYGATQYTAGQAATQSQWDAQTIALNKAAQVAADEASQETQRRITAQKENDDAQAKALATATADRDRASDVAARLRKQVAALAAANRGQAGNHPAPVASGPPAGDAVDLLSLMFSQSDQLAGELAAYGDAARIAGNRCAADYDALTQH